MGKKWKGHSFTDEAELLLLAYGASLGLARGGRETHRPAPAPGRLRAGPEFSTGGSQSCPRAAPARGLPVIGYACVYGQPYYAEGRLERIAPGAFDADLRSGCNLWCLQSHDLDQQYGATGIGPNSLEVWADDYGLAFLLHPRGELGEALVRRLRTYGSCGASIGGGIVRSRRERAHDDVVETVTAWDLRDVSFDTEERPGANPAARAFLVPELLAFDPATTEMLAACRRNEPRLMTEAKLCRMVHQRYGAPALRRPGG